MGRSAFGIMLIAVGLLIGIFWTYPMWSEVGTIKEQKAQADETLERIRNLKTRSDQLAAEYNSIPQEEKEMLDEFFPRKPDSTHWLVNMESIAKANGILLKSVDMEEGRKDATLAVQDAGAVEPTHELFPFKVTFSGNYQAFSTFLDSMEKSRRLIEIDKLVFDTGEGKRDFYEFNVDAHTFWKK